MYLKGAENSIMILWLIAAFTAYFVKGLCGFANGLIFTTILGFGAPNASISPVNTLLGYPSNLILTWKNRENLERKIWPVDPCIGGKYSRHTFTEKRGRKNH